MQKVKAIHQIKVSRLNLLDTIRIKGWERVTCPYKEVRYQFDTSITGIKQEGSFFYLSTTAGLLQPKRWSELVFKLDYDPNTEYRSAGRDRGKTFNGRSIE